MALHTELDIHRDCCRLLEVTIDVVKEMRRDFKATLGTEIRKLVVHMLLMVLRANKTRDRDLRVKYLDQLLEDVDVFNNLMRVCRDTKARLISTGLYSAATKISASIGAQAGGWKKKTESSPVVSPSRR